MSDELFGGRKVKSARPECEQTPEQLACQERWRPTIQDAIDFRNGFGRGTQGWHEAHQHLRRVEAAYYREYALMRIPNWIIEFEK